MKVLTLLRSWLSTSAGWIMVPGRPPHSDDFERLLTILHILHSEAFTLPDHQSSDTSPGPSIPTQVPLSLAAQGIGPTGCVQIPPHIWMECAPGGLLLADARTPSQKPSNCPLVQAMLDALLAAGLVTILPGLPNAEVFVKPKNQRKAALIINMRALNANCPTLPPKFRLPTLLEVGTILLHQKHLASSPCIASIDLANCFWSIRLPASNIGCVRIGTPRHTYALLALPFGWTHAPAIAQRVIHHYLSRPLASLSSPADAAHTIQYLDDIALIASSPATLQKHIQTTSAHLQHAGFLISPKSVLEPQPATTFIGKLVTPALGTIATLPAYYAGVVLQWLSLATGSFTVRKASRLLGKLIWLSQPRRRILPFLAGPYASLRYGPRYAHHTSPNFTRATLEALAIALPAWRSNHIPSSPLPSAPRYFADAARSPWGSYYVGIWSHHMGTRFYPCPHWVTTQQAAELFAALKALQLAAFRHDRHLHLYLDNHAAIYSLLRGKASSPLIPQNRILRRLCYLLHWSSLSAALHYIPSSLNPADPPSRWWTFPTTLSLITSTWRLGALHLLDPPGPSWGTLAGSHRAL